MGITRIMMLSGIEIKWKETGESTMNEWMKNSGKTLVILLAGVLLSRVLYQNNREQIELSMVVFLGVMLVALVTPGYGYGIAASIVGVFCFDFFFLPPLYQFGSNGGSVSMMIAAILISAITSKSKRQATLAQVREQNTIALYQENLRLERERDKIQMQAEQEAQRGILLRAVSHDLRTPLTAISGASSALLDNWDQLEQSQQKKLVEHIQTDSGWLIRMVENLLSVTRIQDGVTKLKKKPEVVEELAADVIQKMKQRFPQVEILLTLPEGFLMVPMDSMLIEQVLINLMENVVRHCGNPNKIGLTIRLEQTQALFEVEDWGKGLPREQQLFDFPLLTGDDVRGAGIGLRVCMTIVKAHGGQMNAWNKQTGGAIFQFSLPLQEENMQ